jgi:conjugal transfer pilus assembly protein TraB
MQKLAELWERKQVRTAVVLGAIGIVTLFIASSMTDDKPATDYSKKLQTKVDGSILGVTGAANEITSREAEDLIDTLSRDFDHREKELSVREEEMKKQNEQLIVQQQALETQLFEIREQMKAMAKAQSQPVAMAQQYPNAAGPNSTQVPQGQPQQNLRSTIVQPQQVITDANGNVINTRQTQIITKAPNTGVGNVIRTVTQRNIRELRDGEVKERDVKISKINQRTQRPEQQTAAGQVKTPLEQAKEAESEDSFTLSMGSIISGTLLNGVAAPTSTDRASNPMPVLMRIKKEAIMPNYYTLDIRECHMIASAIGDLSSSRAIIRAEGISCITNEGKAIEQNIDAYAVSSADGMAGIEGRMVFKSGAMIANGLKAEAIKGFAEAFSPRQVQSLNTSPGATQLWQSQNIDRAAGAGIGQGFAAGANRISEYYLALAEQTHPVIELLPGLEVDFIVQRGMTLRLGGNYTQSAPGRNNQQPSVRLSAEYSPQTQQTQNTNGKSLSFSYPGDQQRTNQGGY